MELDEAVKMMLETRAKMRSRSGVSDPDFISQAMQTLAQATAAVEEHLGQLEQDVEMQENAAFLRYTSQEGRSVNQAMELAKQDVKPLKGQIAKLKRYVSGSWQLVGVAQSRVNHLSAERRSGNFTT